MRILFIVIGILLTFAGFYELKRALAVSADGVYASIWLKFVVLIALAGTAIYLGIKGIGKNKKGD